MSKIRLFLIFACLILMVRYGEGWSISIGNEAEDIIYSIQPTPDGGYIAAGWNVPSTGSGSFDFWLVKLAADGSIQWQKSYGSANTEAAFAVLPLKNGGYLVAGRGFGDASTDAAVVRLDPAGNIVWQKLYGGQTFDEFVAVQPDGAGGFVLAGSTDSFSVTNLDIWVLRINGAGDVLWQKRYGGSLNDLVNGMIRTRDGGYILAGRTDSFGAGKFDLWVLKLDRSGKIQWQKTYGGSGNEAGYSVQQTADGGYAISGGITSVGVGNYDYWLLKLTATGDLQWSKAYGTRFGHDFAGNLIVVPDGGFVLSGWSRQTSSTNFDYWLLRLDSTGSVRWQRRIGGKFNDFPNALAAASDGGFILGGETSSFQTGHPDAWIIKMDQNGHIGQSCRFSNSATTILPRNTSPKVSKSSARPQLTPGWVNPAAFQNVVSSAPPISRCRP